MKNSTANHSMIGKASYKIILVVLLMAWCVSANAQNITTANITWNSVKAVNQADNKDVVYNCSFKTSAQSIDWIQGNHVSDFNVTSTDGQWTNVSQDGKSTFNVQSESISGSITFSRSAGNYSVHLILYVDGKLDQDYVFTITSISSAQ